jgi:hypothetical protein
VESFKKRRTDARGSGVSHFSRTNEATRSYPSDETAIRLEKQRQMQDEQLRRSKEQEGQRRAEKNSQELTSDVTEFMLKDRKSLARKRRCLRNKCYTSRFHRKTPNPRSQARLNSCQAGIGDGSRVDSQIFNRACPIACNQVGCQCSAAS